MSSRTETEAVWQSTPGAQPLYKIYGYWPTLHDAVIRAINVDFANQGLQIVVDYKGLTKNVDQEERIGQRITLRWQGVTEAKLRLYDWNLYGIKFTQRNEMVETRFEDYTWGMDGYILSASVEVAHIEPAPDMSGLHQEDPAAHEIRLSLA